MNKKKLRLVKLIKHDNSEKELRKRFIIGLHELVDKIKKERKYDAQDNKEYSLR